MERMVGFVFIVASAGLLGMVKRSEHVTAQRLCAALAEWLAELQQTVSLRMLSLPELIAQNAQSERYQSLRFLEHAVERLEEGDTLCGSLTHGIEDWEEARLLARDELDELLQVFRSLGEGNTVQEERKLAPALAYFKVRAEQRRCDNEKKRGLYETVFTLVGVIVAVVLV